MKTKIIPVLFGVLALAILGWTPANAQGWQPCSGNTKSLTKLPTGKAARFDVRNSMRPCVELAASNNEGEDDSSASGSQPVAACPRNAKGISLPRGQALSCSCKARQITGSVWGSQRYTADSSVCKAARHAGAIGPNGGKVAVYKGRGCNNFVGTTRNGVRTGRWGRYGSTFAFRYPLPGCVGKSARPTNTSVARACDASFGGKYAGLLRRIKVPKDRGRYGVCRDYGRYSGSSWAGYRNLPAGYWTYKFPNWYIWGRRTR